MAMEIDLVSIDYPSNELFKLEVSIVEYSEWEYRLENLMHKLLVHVLK